MAGSSSYVDHGQARGAARIVVGVGDHDEDRLADVLHQAVGEDRIVVDDRAAVVGAGDVLHGQHRDHAARWRARRPGRCARCSRAALLRQAQRRVQRARTSAMSSV
jgi:restriction endonuclease Mrr